MTKRLQKLIVVRRAASRMASADFSDAAARMSQSHALWARLTGAAAGLAPEIGSVMGGVLGARIELTNRLHAARRVARDRAELASDECGEAAIARKRARRALDAADEMQNAALRAELSRRETRAAPLMAKEGR